MKSVDTERYNFVSNDPFLDSEISQINTVNTKSEIKILQKQL
jgi:hypothetical protein